MAGLVKPRNFPIRRITDLAHRLGRIFNPKRMPDHGGLTSLNKWEVDGNFRVEPPTKIRTADEASKRTSE
jgi:hypothetical protein